MRIEGRNKGGNEERREEWGVVWQLYHTWNIMHSNKWVEGIVTSTRGKMKEPCARGTHRKY